MLDDMGKRSSLHPTFILHSSNFSSNVLDEMLDWFASAFILTKFIPAITGGILITENERKLLSLAPRFGGLGIPIFEELCEIEYQNFIMISEHLCNRITD